MFIGNLPSDATEKTVSTMLSEFGIVRSIRVATDVFTGKCRGFAFVEMEGHEARAAISALDGKTMGDSHLRVRFDNERKTQRGRRRHR